MHGEVRRPFAFSISLDGTPLAAKRGMVHAKSIFVALLVVAMAQAVVYYPQLPQTIASHFDGAGRPNGWSSKATFFAIDVVMMLLVAASFLWAPVAIGKFPLHLWSLPNRDYWLAEERRTESMQVIQGWLLVFGCATMVLMLVTFQLAIQANLNPPPILSPAITIFLIGYFAFTGVWLVLFYRRFSAVPR